MRNYDKSAWPVLWISDQLHAANDVGAWSRKIVGNLEEEQGCAVITSSAYGDAHEIIRSREDLGTIVIDWDLKEMGRIRAKVRAFLDKRQTVANDATNAGNLVYFTRERNKTIPVLLLTGRGSVEDLPNDILPKINGVIWKLTDTPDFLAGRVAQHVIDYSREVMPPFFGELVKYVNEYKYAWHTPGHMGGQGFLTSPSGTAFHKFFGENVLRADLSISVPELGSLLDHSGVTGEAEAFSAEVFGADRTYYVLNGTSTANQIVWRSQVSRRESALVDRNCHKSLNYAMVITGADPEYMLPIRNGLGIIGPVDFSEIPADKKYKMSALTNSTYDGICYNIEYMADKLSNAEINHFDEAWYAYATFHPIYNNHFGMSLAADGKLVFCTQSTHKLLTAFSQASMIHVRLPEDTRKSREATKLFHDRFNESYMMHGSTSPQYNMVASLEVATKMMCDNGEIAWGEIIEEAIELRKKVARIKRDCTPGDWFFDIWQPPDIVDTATETLMTNQDYWLIKKDADWHGFEELPATYTMLDPIKPTFMCPGIDVKGNYRKNQGIPAAIVTNYLIDQGIVCEKTDYYSWLLLNSLGTTKGKQGTLVAELFKFKALYDGNAPLKDVFPSLVAKYPDEYEQKGLQDHCRDMHRYIRRQDLLGKMHKAFTIIPGHGKVTPAKAYQQVVKNNVELVRIQDIDPTVKPRRAAVMLVPYPPGIPIMMGGEFFEKQKDAEAPRQNRILDYLIARQKFENRFPGYESDIHGIERTAPDADGKTYFQTLLIKEK